MKKNKKKEVAVKLAVKGFFRIQIEEEGRIVGDSGWNENRVTNTGVEHYLIDLMLNQAGSLRVSHLALGSGSAPAEADTSLAGEHEKRKVASTSKIASHTAQFYATFGSSDNFVTATATLNNIALVAYSSKGSGSIMAGQTYTSSQVQTNQNVNVSYQIRFATTT